MIVIGLMVTGTIVSLLFGSQKELSPLEGLTKEELQQYKILKEQCENNNGYLSGYEIGKMVEEKCMDNINNQYYTKAKQAQNLDLET